MDLDLRINIMITPEKFWISFFLSQASLLQALQEAQKVGSVLHALIQRLVGELDNATKTKELLTWKFHEITVAVAQLL